MRAFTKEVSPWISECEAWNAEWKLARANNAHARAGTGNHAQGVVKIVIMGRDGSLSTSQPRGAQGRIIRTQTIMIMCLHRIGHLPNTTNNMMVEHPCVTNVGVGHISCNYPSAQNYTEQGQVRDNLN